MLELTLESVISGREGSAIGWDRSTPAAGEEPVRLEKSPRSMAHRRMSGG